MKSNFSEPKTMKQEKIASFKSIKDAREFRRLISIGCIECAYPDDEIRITQGDTMYNVYKIVQ